MKKKHFKKSARKKKGKKKMIPTSETPSLIALEVVFNQSKPFSKNKKQPDSQPKRSRKPISRNEGKKREEEDETELPNAISYGIGYLQSMQNHLKKIKDNPIPIPRDQQSPFQEVEKRKGSKNMNSMSKTPSLIE